MGFIGSMFSNDKGAGFQAGSAQLQNPTNNAQADRTSENVAQALAQQAAFAQAAQSPNGLGNQANIFNQYGAIAAGQGPNPAQAMLAQQTGANNQAQGALMASQRGAGANAGLIARQAAMQGSANQQNAIGQAATMQAQQQLAALGQQSNIAGTQVAQQQNALMGQNQFAQGQQSNILGSIAQQNNAAVGMQSNINNANSSIAAGNQKFQSGMFSGLLGGAASGLGMAAGGDVPPLGVDMSMPQMQPLPLAPMQAEVLQNPNGPKSKVGQILSQPFRQQAQEQQLDSAAEAGKAVGQDIGAGISKGVSALNALFVNQGGPIDYRAGGSIPGQAQVSGDSLKNDTVPAMLSPGEIVVPRSKAQDPKSAAQFAAAVAMKKGRK